MKFSIIHKSIVLISGLIFTICLTSFYSERKAETPIHQLRIYQVPKINREAFHERFEKHAMRIMKKYNFQILTTWETTYDEKLEFVYLLQWKDEETMKTAWKNFLDDPEWKSIKEQTSKIHGKFVESIQDRTLTLTNYSPLNSLTP